MSKIFKSLMSLVQREDATAAELLAGLQEAQTEAQAAYTAVQLSEKAYHDNLLNPDDDVLARIEDDRRAAKLRMDRTRALQGVLQERFTAAQEADRRAEVDRLHARADAAAEAYRNSVMVDLPLVIEAVRGILRLGAEAEIDRQAAMEADKTRVPRPAVDAFRSAPDRPRRELGKAREVEMWCRSNGDRLSEELQDLVLTSQDGTGFMRHGTGSSRFNHRRRFRRIEVLDVEFGQAAEPLARALAIPGLGALDAPGWRPLDSSDPRAVLAALDRLERHVEPDGDTRQPRVEYVPIGELIEVGRPTGVIEDLANRRAS